MQEEISQENNWIFEGSPYQITDEAVNDNKLIGFVYLIEDTKLKMKYIGKKLFHSKRTRQIKGKKKKFLVSSDWRKYYGSNKLLKERVGEERKEDRFIRTILHICNSKSECSFLELKEQIERDALLRQDYYNEWIMVRIRKSHLKSLWIKL